jgi:hypothetical protein
VLKETVKVANGIRVVLMDSISYVEEADAGQAVVSASHGGRSSGEYACRFPLGVALFNDAGIGKDSAGTAALGMLDAIGRAGATIAHDSARIGDARDHWAEGRISAANAKAAEAGIQPGQSVQEAVETWLKAQHAP